MSTYSLKPGQSQMAFPKLDKNAKYYLKFEAPSQFGGTIEGLKF